MMRVRLAGDDDHFIAACGRVVGYRLVAASPRLGGERPRKTLAAFVRRCRSSVNSRLRLRRVSDPNAPRSGATNRQPTTREAQYPTTDNAAEGRNYARSAISFRQGDLSHAVVTRVHI